VYKKAGQRSTLDPACLSAPFCALVSALITSKSIDPMGEFWQEKFLTVEYADLKQSIIE
jgi:hypothetical protein